jgi:hypothetical protein
VPENTGPRDLKSADAVGRGGVVVGGANSASINTGQQVSGDLVEGDKILGDKIGTQIDSGGGAVFLRAVEAQTIVGRDQITQYVTYGSLPIVWPQESEQRYLKRVQDEFAAHLRCRSLRAAEQGSWDTGFVHPLLSCRRMTRGVSGAGGQRTDETKTGVWRQLVTGEVPVGLLVGDAHSGRSLLLRWLVADLASRSEAKEGSVLPIYLSLSRFPFKDAWGLLDTAAFACGQQPETMREYWYRTKRRVVLAIDDADQIPIGQRDSFLLALQQLDASRGSGHGILVCCRPGSDATSLPGELSRILATSAEFAQWVILPLDAERIQRLLDAYDAESWLKALVERNERLRWLVRLPGLLAHLVQATRGLHLIAPPHNLAQLYQLFVDGYLFGGVSVEQQAGSTEARKRYHYGRVKQRLLAYLAFRMLASSRPSGIEVDDALCKDLAKRLEALASEFSRTRRYMPDDWNVSDALQELFESAVIDRDAARADQFEFSDTAYRDYFAAVHLHNVGEEWQEAARLIKASNLEDWTDVLILLSGLPPKDTTNALLNEVLAERPSLAADLWLEKGAVGFTKVPQCVERAFTDRRGAIQVPEWLDHPVQAAVPYFHRISRSSQPEVALQAVNGLMQLGVDAIDPLLDAAETGHPLVVASAVHALFHMGPRLANDRPVLEPLLETKDRGFVLTNLGACNARIGDLALVSVPRTMQAEIKASFGQVDFDLFTADYSFELWHTPVAWFAIDYFLRIGRVDWIGLAAACDGVVRCAGLIVGKAQRRRSMEPIVEEMTQCAIAYDRLGRWIADDLTLAWPSDRAYQAPPPITESVDKCYKELRLALNPANRGRTLGAAGESSLVGTDSELVPVAVEQIVAEVGCEMQAVEVGELSVDGSDVADLPTLRQLTYKQNVGILSEGGRLGGIHVERVAPTPVRAVEVISLVGAVGIGHCEQAEIDGILIDSLPKWDGVRVRLELNVGNLERTRLTGIRAVAPPGTIEPGAMT